jgi:hypothetical protein
VLAAGETMTGEPERPRVDNEPISHVFDQDHDVPVRPRLAVPIDVLADYQRLVVNPLLAILVAVVGTFLIQSALRTKNLFLFGASVGLLLLAFLLIQFHCLDCRSTGWYLHASRHACDPVLDRYSKRGPRPRGLSLRTQRLIWVYILVSIIVGAAVSLLARL